MLSSYSSKITTDGSLKRDEIEEELFSVELLANDDEKFILTIGKKDENIVFIADEKYNLTPIYYKASLDFDDFMMLGKAFRLCDDMDNVEKTLRYFLEKFSDKEKNYDLSIKKVSKKNFLLCFNVLLTANQKEEFTIELKGIEQSPLEINSYLRDILKLYLKEYGTEIIDEKELLTSLFISMRHYIITDIKDLQIIFKGIKHQTNKKIKKMKLIYSALEDGDSAESFHKHCDGISNTLIIIKTINGKKFGGFTTQKWKNNNNYIMDNAAFLFSLDEKECYYINDCEHAIYGNKTRGPCFGGGFDLCIHDGCLNNNNSYECSGVSYDMKGKKLMLNGENQFQIDDYEVYQIYLL